MKLLASNKKAATGDAIAVGVSLVVFWPALFLLASDSDKKDELARLKGEYDAIQQAANQKSCGVAPK